MADTAGVIRSLVYRLYAVPPLGKNGVIDNVFNALQKEFNVAVDKKVLSLDSAWVKVPPEPDRKTSGIR